MSQTRWTGDYRSTGYVDWPEGLRDELKSERHRLIRPLRLWPAISFIPLAVSIYLNALSFLNNWTSGLAVLSWLAVGASVILLAFGLMRARGARSRRAAIGRALRSDRLEHFALDQSKIDEILIAHSKHHPDGSDFDPLAHITRNLLVASEPGLLICVDDRPGFPMTEVQIKTLSEYADIERSADGYQVPLTQDEIRELRKYRRNHLLVLPSALILLAVFGGGLVLSAQTLNSGAPMSFRDWKLVIGTLAFAAIVGYIMFYELPKKLRLARVIRCDIEGGFCDILEGVAAMEGIATSGVPKLFRPQVPPVLVRRLPHSGLWWMLDDTPAPWRRFSE